MIATWVQGHPDIIGFHDLRLSGAPDSLECAADLVVRQERIFAEFDAMLLTEARQMGRRLPEIRRFDIRIEPEFASDREHRRIFLREGNDLVLCPEAEVLAIG